MKPIQAGQLRHRVTIQSPTEVRNSLGEPVATWADVDTVWAEVRPIAGREFAQLQSTQAEQTGRIFMRYRTDLRPKWRVVHGTHTYDVQAVINVEERGEYLEVAVKEVISGQ